jgi:hypothetical protein
MGFQRTRERNSGYIIKSLGNNQRHAKEKTPCDDIVDYPNTNAPSYFERYERCLDSLNPNHPDGGSDLDLIRREIYFQDAYVPAQQAGWSYLQACKYLDQGKWKTIYGRSSIYWLGYRRAAYPYPQKPVSCYNECKNLGPWAWEKFKPAQPKVSLGIFIAELRDVGMLLFTKALTFKSLGNNYLAYQFGWAPMMRDLWAWFESICQIDKQINQLIRDNGKWIERKGKLYKTVTSELVEAPYFSGGPITSLHPSSWTTGIRCFRTTTVEETAWFSGTFKYCIPGLNQTIAGRTRALRRLWGLEFTPTNLWAILPFSWLLDWIVDIGRFISNYDSMTEDNLVAKYAYVMLTKKTTIKTEVVFSDVFDGSESRNIATSEVIYTSKARAKATPFGFGINTDFSKSQLAILAALGMSRS